MRSKKNAHLSFKRVGEQQLDEVIELVTRVYKEEGFVEEKESAHSAISDFLRSITATTFGAFYGNELVGTISIVEDSDRGLPMDVIFKRELDEKRDAGLRIAEVCQFAVDKKMIRVVAGEEAYRYSTKLSMELLKLVFHFALYKNLDLLSLTINPRHRSFYEALGCIQIGTLQYYPSVNNAPALAYVLDLHASGTNKPESWLISEIVHSKPDGSIFEDL